MALQHLALAERHIDEGEKRLDRQLELITELDRDGHDTKAARRILATMRDTQVILRGGRERLLRTLEK